MAVCGTFGKRSLCFGKIAETCSCNTAKKIQHNIAVLLWHRCGSCDTVGVYNTFGLSVSAILQIPCISIGLYTCCGRREICFFMLLLALARMLGGFLHSIALPQMCLGPCTPNGGPFLSAYAHLDTCHMAYGYKNISQRSHAVGILVR